jgi:hypothetical protein
MDKLVRALLNLATRWEGEDKQPEPTEGKCATELRILLANHGVGRW